MYKIQLLINFKQKYYNYKYVALMNSTQYKKKNVSYLRIREKYMRDAKCQ